MNDSGCTKPVSVRGLRTASLPFSSIPSQSRLFIEYLEDPLSLRRFYPSAVESALDVAERASGVLSNYSTDRSLLCDALERINTPLGASARTLEYISDLRASETVAVLTGQQAGLFTGPIYTVYKALSAIKMAEELRSRGTKAVPVFWVASEDHDFAEISAAWTLDRGDQILESRITSVDGDDGKPVGKIALTGAVAAEIEELFEALPETEFTAGLRSQLGEAYREGAGVAGAFASLLTQLLGKFGLVIVDPLYPEIKQLAAPFYRAAIEQSGEIVSALRNRGRELDETGYHAQVLVDEDYFPLFWHSDDGRRIALRRKSDGSVQVKGEKRSFSLSELHEIASAAPERFSPGVMLRPAVQDFLFPTICYFGGGAEVAYFAQNSEVYRVLDRPVTPIFHRQSFTVVESRHARTLDTYDLRLTDLFQGPAVVVPRILDQCVDPETAELFSGVEDGINKELGRLDEALSKIDVTLAANLATRRRKILYHIGAIRKKYYIRRAETDATINRRLSSLFTSLLPNGELQERSINIVSYLDRFGPAFIDSVYESIDLEDKGHRIIYL